MTDADEFRAHVIASGSVTGAMEEWCAARGIGTLPLRSVVHSRASVHALPPGVRFGRTTDPVFYRSITLMAGRVPLLDADNWFLPARLDAEAVSRLLATDTPFGALFAPESQSRRPEVIRVPPGASDLDARAEEHADTQVLTLRSRMSVDGTEVAYIEERFHPDAIAG